MERVVDQSSRGLADSGRSLSCRVKAGFGLLRIQVMNYELGLKTKWASGDGSH